MEDESEVYLTCLEENHLVLVRSVDPEVFLDYLRQHHVLSGEDCQLVQNYYVNTTRRARMRTFMDILRTKGPDGISQFFKQLGWEYPHIYREIVREEPKPPPERYKQGQKSRLSCDLNHILIQGLDLKRLDSQKEDLVEQITDMQAMLKHQEHEIVDLERENKRLRQYQTENHHIQERLHTLSQTNDEIKEENRQFLREIRHLTIDLQKHRDQEVALQAELDEVTQQIHLKSYELNRMNKEESDLRAKFERVRQASLRFQSPSQKKNTFPDIVAKVAEAKKEDTQRLRQEMEILMDDMRNMEETNSELCEKLKYMQELLNEEKNERDQLHKQVTLLQHDKNILESRQTTSTQKIERFFTKIKELEEQKRKTEEERIHMQTKVWEMSMESEKQFVQMHKLESKYECLQQKFDQFRQEHHFCVVSEPSERQRQSLPGMKGGNNVLFRPGCTKVPVFITANDRPLETCAAASPDADIGDLNCSLDVPDGKRSPESGINPTSAAFLLRGKRSDSLKVNISSSMKEKKTNTPADKEADFSDCDDNASTSSEESNVSSVIFDPVDVTEASGYFDLSDAEQTGVKEVTNHFASGNFFVRFNVKEDIQGDREVEGFEIREGDIVYVIEAGHEHWRVMGVDKLSSKLQHQLQAKIPNPDRFLRETIGQTIRRNSNSDGNSKSNTLLRAGAIRYPGRDVMKQHSTVAVYTTVSPRKANRLLPVLVLCLPSAMQQLLLCMETAADEWACVCPEGCTEPSHLFTQTQKHKILPWEIRPKANQKYDSNLHNCIILIVTLESKLALPTLRHLLGEPNLDVDIDQEMKSLNERKSMVRHAGLHSETVTIRAGHNDREAFWEEIREKVSQVQQRIFWLETSP